MKNVNYRGAVKRDELIKIQKESEFHLYPGVYPELFCIAIAESQAAGVIPITSKTGALETTNRFGYKIDGSPVSTKFMGDFVDLTVNLMKSADRPQIGQSARIEFGIDKILEQWDEVFHA
jgi:glycosyltransferase involved in cell wall biosynthesis